MPDALATLTTQKASAALGAAIAGPMLLEPLIARVAPTQAPLIGVAAGLGLVWLGAAMLDGHLESIVVGAGVGLAAKSALRLVLKVDAPSA